MEDKDFESLKGQMAAVGYEHDLQEIKEFPHGASFYIADAKNFGEDLLLLNWGIDPVKTGGFQIQSVGAFLGKDISIPTEKINRIDPVELEYRLQRIEWNKPDTYQRMLMESSMEHQAVLDLTELYYAGPRGREVHDKLAYKYIANTLGEDVVPNMNELKLEYDRKLRIELRPDMLITGSEIYNLLNGRFINKPVNEGGTRRDAWFKVDIKEKSESGFSSFQHIALSQGFDFNRAFQNVGIKDYQSILSDEAIMKRIKQGDLVSLTFQQNNLEGKRAFYADPENGTMKIDRDETHKLGFYHELPKEISLGEDMEYTQQRRRRG
jgi:hypothetical protein